MCGVVAVFGRCFAFFLGGVCRFSLLCLLFFVVMFVVFRCGVCVVRIIVVPLHVDTWCCFFCWLASGVVMNL